MFLNQNVQFVAVKNQDLSNHKKIFKMNEIINKFLLAEDILMSKMHLKQPGFMYSASGPFSKNKERIQKFKETGNL